MGNDAFRGEPETTREAIMKATFHALCEHGYADLTIQRIADRFEKSKSLLYHHYDSKDDLLLDFLSFMLEEYERSMPQAWDEGADAHLDEIFDRVFAEDIPDERREFERAMSELRAQAAHDDRYREHFTRHDTFFRDRLRAVVESGIEAGVFRDVDPEDVASFLHTVIGGELLHRSTADLNLTSAVREQLRSYVDDTLLIADADGPEGNGESGDGRGVDGGRPDE